MRSALFYTFAFACITGVGLGNYISYTMPVFLLCIGMTTVFFILSVVPRFRFCIFLLLACVGLLLGSMRMYFARCAETQLPLASVGQHVHLSGMVSEIISQSSHKQRFIFDVNESVPYRVQVSVYSQTSIQYGDMVSVSGILMQPEDFVTNTGSMFHYRSYLKAQGIFFVMNNPNVTLSGTNTGNPIMAVLLRVSDAVTNHIMSVLPGGEGVLMSGILLGDRSGIQDMRNDFITTGTIHIVALSGYNISIVARSVMSVLRLVFARSIAVVFGCLSIVVFVLMTGASTTAIRAGVMSLLGLLALVTGRPYSIFRALVLAVVAMLLWNPYLLLSDMSFQLSVLATLGMIWIEPIVARWARWIPVKIIRELLSATLAAQIAVLPYIVYATGLVSLIAIPVNMLVLPFVPFTMLLGACIGGLGFLGNICIVPFGYVAHVFLKYMLQIISWGASVPHAAVIVPNVPLVVMIVGYVFLVAWVGMQYKAK